MEVVKRPEGNPSGFQVSLSKFCFKLTILEEAVRANKRGRSGGAERGRGAGFYPRGLNFWEPPAVLFRYVI